MKKIDTSFVTSIHRVAAARTEQLLATQDHAISRLGHRVAMQNVKLMVSTLVSPENANANSTRTLARIGLHLRHVESLQSRTGLLRGDSNIESTPDTAFTIGDAADTAEIVRRHDTTGQCSALGQRLESLIQRAVPALLRGGVHTPNHRWEVAAALARSHRLWPDVNLRTRVDEWLAEGVDIQPDGMYSERSATYAALVTNPSLLAISDIFQRPDLLRIVARNLTSYSELFHQDGTVETVHSRRQDQRQADFSLAYFAPALRRCAIALHRGDLAWAAQRAHECGVPDPHTILGDMLLHPSITNVMPTPEMPPIQANRAWCESGIVLDKNPSRTLLIAGSNDFHRVGRVQSGVATNPTFLRIFSGNVVISSLRLSRVFFGFGPFRSHAMTSNADGTVLAEHISGHYYQPLPPEKVRKDATYAFEDEGRFSSAMSFDARTHHSIELNTQVTVTPTERGAVVELDLQGAEVKWSLEIAFGHDTTVTREGDGKLLAIRGGDRILVKPTGDLAAEEVGFYEPGDQYSYLGGTDALTNPRHYISGFAPGRARIEFTRD